MTGGRVVVLGPTGRNFAAGMSGGVAYVLDEQGDFVSRRLNAQIVSAEEMDCDDEAELRELVERHLEHTGSSVARRALDDWDVTLPRFVKVMPNDFRRVLNERAAAAGMLVEAS
jgi:glutamate synthase domain-containing protein 3